MKKRWSVLLIFILVCGLLSGCGRKKPSLELLGDESPAADTAAFPAFEGEDLNSGKSLSSADFADYELTLVNVWATWCGPCVAELPHLQEINSSYQDQGVRVLGLLLEQESGAAEAARELLADAGADYAVLQPEGELLEYLYDNILYFPTTFLVDSQGKILGEPVIGAHDLAGWKTIVENALEA